MDNETQTNDEPGFNFAEPTEALSVDKSAQLLADTLRSTRDRASNGQFAKKEVQAEPVEEKVVDLKTGKPPVAEEPAKAEAEDDEDDPDIEFPPEEEGKEPTRRKLSEVLAGYEKAATLEKEVETLRTKTSEVPVEYTNGLQDAIQARGQYLKGLEFVSKMFNPQAPNVAMLDPNHPSYDPDAYRAGYLAFEQSKKAVEQIRSEHEQLTKEQRANQEAWTKAHLARERDALFKAWPEAKNPEVSKQVTESLKRDYGFTPEEIAATTDHRMFLVIRDALEFRASKAKQAEAVKVVRQKPKLVKGAARTTTDSKAAGRTQAMARLSQTGSVDAAAQAIKSLGLI